ncbi:MAG: hypothetical protein U1A77_04380 [Pirellulales bacterium]
MSFARRPAFFTPGSRPLPPLPESPAPTSPPAWLLCRSSRRQFLRQLSACSALATAAFAAPTFADSPAASASKAADKAPSTEKFTLKSPRAPGEVRQVSLKIEAAGDLKLNADGQKVARRPVQVAAEFAYEESTAANETPVRHYAKAEAKLQVGNTSFPTQLTDQRRVVAIHREGEQVTLYSPLGPLTRDELDLLQAPGNSDELAELLPVAAVAIGETWKISDTTLARLLWLEAVSESSVTATLKSVTDSVALVTFQGPVSGAVGGISTDIDLQGKLNVDLREQLLTWLALGIKENRAIGHAEPGFETTTQVKVATRRAASTAQLTPQLLASLPLEYQSGSSLLQYESTQGRFRALLDRRWRVMLNRHDLTVLRLVDRGDLIAQCNLSRLPALAPGKQLPLEELQDDIKQSLGKNFRQFVEASQAQTDDGLRVLRASVVGEASDLAVQWNYYHVSNEQGQRLAMVFTFESNLVDRFADIDRPLVASVQFLTDPEPTPAPDKKDEPAKSASKDAKPTEPAESTSQKKSARKTQR